MDTEEQINKAKEYLNTWLNTQNNLREMMDGEIEIARKNVISPIACHVHGVRVTVNLKTNEIVTYIDDVVVKSRGFTTCKWLNYKFLCRLDTKRKPEIIDWLCKKSITYDEWLKIFYKEINDATEITINRRDSKLSEVIGF